MTHAQNLPITSLVLTKYYSGDQIEKNEVGGACNAFGEEERCIQSFGGETLEDRGVVGKIILRQIFRKWEWRGTWTGLIRLMAGSCKRDNEPSGSRKCGKFLD